MLDLIGKSTESTEFISFLNKVNIPKAELDSRITDAVSITVRNETVSAVRYHQKYLSTDQLFENRLPFGLSYDKPNNSKSLRVIEESESGNWRVLTATGIGVYCAKSYSIPWIEYRKVNREIVASYFTPTKEEAPELYRFDGTNIDDTDAPLASMVKGHLVEMFQYDFQLIKSYDATGESIGDYYTHPFRFTQKKDSVTVRIVAYIDTSSSSDLSMSFYDTDGYRDSLDPQSAEVGEGRYKMYMADFDIDYKDNMRIDVRVQNKSKATTGDQTILWLAFLEYTGVLENDN
ncbi:MAG: hypothetical protein HEP71_02615 [Roseivirga sp.]|nr:hypothetical protein [Roseivirga sp.]